MTWPVLLLVTLLLPLVWGWLMYWLLTKFWPPGETSTPPPSSTAPPLDYQI